MLDIIIKLAGVTLVSMLCVMWIHDKILRVAQMKDIVDNPDARKLQKRPIPVLGGLAVFFGLQSGILLAACLFGDFYGLLPVLLACSLMLYIGSLDDIMDLSPVIRLVLETLTVLGMIYGSGMCVDSFHGMWGIHEFSWWIGVPLTVFAGVGIINAFNMVDGVNGLSSGLCILCSTLLGVFFYKSGDPVDASLAFCFTGALLPFFMHNVFGNKSRMFIGDGGTMVMGTMITWFVIRVLSHNGIAAVRTLTAEGLYMNMAAILFAVASVPVVDTLRVMTMRILRGRSPFLPDRTHLHHAFIDLGVSHTATTFYELLLDILVVGAWYITYLCGIGMDGQMLVTLIVSAILIVGTYLILATLRQRGGKVEHHLSELHQRTKCPANPVSTWLTRWLDRHAED